MALKLAFNGFSLKSGSRKPIWAVEMIPTPPAFATAPAREDRLMPTPMPPWITGFSITRSPITNGFIFSIIFLLERPESFVSLLCQFFSKLIAGN